MKKKGRIAMDSRHQNRIEKRMNIDFEAKLFKCIYVYLYFIFNQDRTN
jgi:hypothetical protein